ncbi:MAG: hypothetical protein AAF899_18860 [Pseudomonadota bacterium]
MTPDDVSRGASDASLLGTPPISVDDDIRNPPIRSAPLSPDYGPMVAKSS